MASVERGLELLGGTPIPIRRPGTCPPSHAGCSASTRQSHARAQAQRTRVCLGAYLATQDCSARALAALDAAQAEVMVVAAYGLILPQWVLDLPPRGCSSLACCLRATSTPSSRAPSADDTPSSRCPISPRMAWLVERQAAT